MAEGWSGGPADQPAPPQNVEILSPFEVGILDIRWDNPALLARNSAYAIVGVNIYRCDTNDRGPFIRINEFPLGGNFFRDQTMAVPTSGETIGPDAWIFRGDKPNSGQWTFRTKYPILKPVQVAPFTSPTYGSTPDDVQVFIDGVEVPVDSVFGETGEVTLINAPTWDVSCNEGVPAVLPGEGSVVQVCYMAGRDFVRSGLDTKIWYRLTTVVLDSTTPSGLRETDLAYCQAHCLIEVERLDYIWKRAIRMNHWILQQGGERVKLFIRRQTGIPCPCTIEAKTRAFSKQPSNRCQVCYGAGFCGGYDGPFDVIVAPDDAERKVAQTPTGRRLEHSYEIWMGPSPVVSHRDLIVKQTNERYSIGGVRRPTNRGNLLQQHFTINFLDEGDTRYTIPIDGVCDYTFPETRYSYVHAPSLPVDGDFPDTVHPWTGDPPFPVGSRNVNPMITEKGSTPDEVEQRGRTPVWENINL